MRKPEVIKMQVRYKGKKFNRLLQAMQKRKYDKYKPESAECQTVGIIYCLALFTFIKKRKDGKDEY